jgi:micrococcal nuclease
VDVRVSGRRERVRLIGIDTPESVALERPHDCWGKEASAVTALLLPVGTAVRLERDVEPRDKYGRLLAYIYRTRDELFVNLELARVGAAGELRIAPNVAHAGEFAGAVAAARQAGLGLWGACGGNHVHLAQ